MRFVDAKEGFIKELQGIYEKGEAEAIFSLAIEKLTGFEGKEHSRIRQDQISVQVEEELQRIVSRLLQHEPIQYILQEAWFCGLRFNVDKNVLIPRPETEELVEWVISDCRFPVDELSILDVGTGSGCIAISLKRRIRKARVFAIDVSQDALTIAIQNSKTLGTPVEFIPLDFLDHKNHTSLGNFNILVSNPPYIPVSDASQLDKNVLKYEPSKALFVPDEDVVIFYRFLSNFGLSHLNEGGRIYAEIHPDHSQKVREIFESDGYKTDFKQDMQGKVRMIRARRDH